MLSSTVKADVGGVNVVVYLTLLDTRNKSIYPSRWNLPSVVPKGPVPPILNSDWASIKVVPVDVPFKTPSMYNLRVPLSAVTAMCVQVWSETLPAWILVPCWFSTYILPWYSSILSCLFEVPLVCWTLINLGARVAVSM